MQAKLTVPCELSRTGSHDVTFTFSTEDGRVVSMHSPCNPDSEETDVTVALGSACCGKTIKDVREVIAECSGYAPSHEWARALGDMLKRTGSCTPSLFVEMLASAVTGAVRMRESREVRALPKPAGQTEIERRWTRSINAIRKEHGLQYRLRAKHYPGEGVKIQTEYAHDNGSVCRWETIAVAPTGSKQAFAVRTHNVIGAVKTNRASEKPNWCMVCGAPIRGMYRHAVSAPHRAKVRRDVFHLVKAVWPNRIVREAFPTQLPSGARNMLEDRVDD